MVVKPSANIDAEGQRASSQVVVRNYLGLHSRASVRFRLYACEFESDILVKARDQIVDGKSMLGLFILAASSGTVLSVTAVGADANEAVRTLATLVDTGFGEVAEAPPLWTLAKDDQRMDAFIAYAPSAERQIVLTLLVDGRQHKTYRLREGQSRSIRERFTKMGWVPVTEP